MRSLIALLMLVSFYSAFGSPCDVSTAPLCPGSGNGILDDRYPSRALVISGEPFIYDSNVGQALPAKTAFEAMRAFGFNGSQMPDIIFPGDAKQFEDFRARLREQLSQQGKPAAEIDALLDEKLRHANGKSWTWQQDYFESTFDATSGNPRLRYSSAYKEDLSATLAAIGGAGTCGVGLGSRLQSSITTMSQEKRDELVATQGAVPKLAGEYGGNFEGLPEGLCLAGNNASVEFTEQICGAKENIVQIDVGWLDVGHVDEIFKVVPARFSDRPQECAFSILSADTDLGVSLFGESLNRAGNLIDLNLNDEIRGYTPETIHADSEESLFYYVLGTHPGGKLMCRATERLPTQTPAPDSPKAGGATEAWVRWIIPYAHAAASAKDFKAYNCVQRLQDVRGSDFNEVLKETPGLIEYNRLIQQSLLRSREVIYQRVLGRLPQCRKFFPTSASMFTPVPNIFSPKNPDTSEQFITEIDGKRQLVLSKAGAHSLFPNPTNAVLINRSMLLPGPLPHVYQTYLDTQLKRLGVEPRYMDTWEYAHVGQGNLHCSTHTLPYCKPRN